jgi:hypothetical protein
MLQKVKNKILKKVKNRIKKEEGLYRPLPLTPTNT